MSQPTHEKDVPQEEALVGTIGLDLGEDDLPQEEGLVDTTDLDEEVDEEEDPPEGEEELEKGEDATQLAALGALARTEVLRRGKSWITERVMYSQEKYHSNKFGRYRQDCSGYVSMCWRLGKSYTTATIMQVAHRITRNQLRPGDALWRRRAGKGHIALFIGRNEKGLTVVYEEYTRGQPCKKRVWSRNHESSFTPIRYNRIS